MRRFQAERARFDQAMGIALALLVGISIPLAASRLARGAEPQPAWTPGVVKSPIRFSRDGTLKIVQFTDTQDDQNIDPRTVRLIETVLATEKPQLVVFTGDNITAGPTNEKEVRKAIDSFVHPVEASRIPWLITFGNHDEDHTSVTHVDKRAMLRMYMSYPYNVNQPDPPGVDGVGNMQLLVYASRGRAPVFNVWALDSGEYAPEAIGDQVVGDDFMLGWNWMPTWDWIKPSQVRWYTETSRGLERLFGKRVPALMFFHIPLPEFRAMYENDASKRAHPEAGLAPQHGVSGERNEDECPGAVNSGLFSALLDRGDVKGVFVGHDHVNNYVGNYFGITLGYSGNTGFGTYGLGGAENHRLRGARVFVVHEDTPERFETKVVLAKDYGIQ